MSFKWKWLLTTFVAQLLLGGIFTTIQYIHMGKLAEQDLLRIQESFQSELTKAHLANNSHSLNALSSIVRDFYSRHKPAAVWVNEGSEMAYAMGDVPDDLTPAATPLLSIFDLPNTGQQLKVLFDENEVYRGRNDMLFYLAGVFLLSALACSMILLGLSNTLSARLEDLRSKAMELQSGKIQSRIEVTGRDEISCLGAAFNSMAQAIELQMKAMEQSHARSVSEKNRLDMLLSSLASGVKLLNLTLHVGAGTFLPVKTDNVDEHVMHSERYAISGSLIEAMIKAKENGGKVVAVGTTSLRALEAWATETGCNLSTTEGLNKAAEFAHRGHAGDTQIFIKPGYSFKVVDRLITNFHLPKSTLLMLVSAFAGKTNILNAYAHAIAQQYRFFSYGDAMWLERSE